MGHSPEIFFRRAGSLEDAELASGRSDDCLLAKFLGLVPRYTTSSSSSSSSLSTRGISRGRVPRYSISSLSLSITVSSSSTSKLESTTAPYGRRRLWNPDILARVKALWKILRSGSPGLLAFGYQWRISALINRVRRLSSHVSFIGCPGWRCAGPLHRWRLFDRWVYLILIGQSIFVCALSLNCTALAVTFHVPWYMHK